MALYDAVHADMQAGRVIAAYALDRHGIAAAVSKMAFGNMLGVKIEHNLDPRDFFAPGFGDLVAGSCRRRMLPDWPAPIR